MKKSVKGCRGCESAVRLKHSSLMKNKPLIKDHTRTVFSCAKLAYAVCNKEERALYYDYEVPVFNILSCCRNLFGIMDKSKYDFKLNKYLFDVDVCAEAAKNGHIDCLKIAHQHGIPWDETTSSSAARRGQLECLKYVHQNGCKWNEHTCNNAAKGGYIDCLKYARENGCNWNESTPEFAARQGHLDCLKYFHENGGSWNRFTCEDATIGGHVDCLSYAYNHGCPWDVRKCYTLAQLHYGYSIKRKQRETKCFQFIKKYRILMDISAHRMAKLSPGWLLE